MLDPRWVKYRPRLPSAAGLKEATNQESEAQKRGKRNETEALLSDTNNFIRAQHGEYLNSRGNRGPPQLKSPAR
jgi:hypothetical protein